jgi:hypothetical protein
MIVRIMEFRQLLPDRYDKTGFHSGRLLILRRQKSISGI